MRNLKSFVHTPPLSQNSFKKTQRPIIQNVPVEKLSKKRNYEQRMCQEICMPMPSTGEYSVKKYAFKIQNAFPIKDRNSKQINTEDTCCWFTNIQKSPTDCKRFIVFDKIKYTVKNHANPQFIDTFYISIDKIKGYINQFQQQTENVVALDLSNVEATYTQQDIRTYDLLYQSNERMKWQIPNDLTSIKMRINVDGQDVILPLTCPLMIRFTIQQEPNK